MLISDVCRRKPPTPYRKFQKPRPRLHKVLSWNAACDVSVLPSEVCWRLRSYLTLFRYQSSNSLTSSIPGVQVLTLSDLQDGIKYIKD